MFAKARKEYFATLKITVYSLKLMLGLSINIHKSLISFTILNYPLGQLVPLGLIALLFLYHLGIIDSLYVLVDPPKLIGYFFV